jgi:glucan endo-1,3-alpha-glucosidase
MVELISWNDFGESHYVGEIAPAQDQPNSTGWTTGFPHTALLSLINLYATAFKTGKYPSYSDKIWLWSRPHPRAPNPTNPTNSRPTHWDWTNDNLYVVVTLSSAATVQIQSGSNYANFNLPAGMSKLAVASAAGVIKAQIVRGSSTVKSYDSTGKFSYVTTPKDYNYNYFVAEA